MATTYERRIGAVYKARKARLAGQGRSSFAGDGYIGGDFPGGVATIDGVPASVEVRVLWRAPGSALYDGALVAKTTAAADGTWRISGLNQSLKYDVVGRKGGFNDVIMSDVTPVAGP